MTFRDYVAQEYGGHSFVLYRAMGHIEHAASDLYKLDGIAHSAWDDDVCDRGFASLLGSLGTLSRSSIRRGYPNTSSYVFGSNGVRGHSTNTWPR